jgi:aromatic-L-amino-acid/L-tryptophan decarboxylase
MLERNDFGEGSKKVTSWIEKYYSDLESFPVKSKVRPNETYNLVPPQAPVDPQSLDEILNDLDRIILPGITHWQHPNFHAYFTANSSVESVFAEMITAAIGAQCMIWDTSPAAAELEERMMEWLRDALGLPAGFEGVIQDTASSATLAAIITAREVTTGFRSNSGGVPPHLRVYCSTQTHSSIEKGVAISGIGTNNLVKVPVDDNQRMIPEELELCIRKDLDSGLKPCCVVATIGTTGTLAVDPVKEIAAITSRYKIWLHIDAAYAGSALILPEYRWMSEGVEQADSFVFNPHKWLFTNFDCSAYYVKDAGTLIRTFEILPEYLKTRTRGMVNDYRDWGIPLGRRFRALKLWFVMRSYGIRGLQEKLREQIRLNGIFAERLGHDERFEIIGKPFLNFTCFRYHPSGISDMAKLNEMNSRLLETINKKGKIFISHTKIGEMVVIRFVFGQTYALKKHMLTALGSIRQTASDLFS